MGRPAIAKTRMNTLTGQGGSLSGDRGLFDGDMWRMELRI
jgi:hypothetical protein